MKGQDSITLLDFTNFLGVGALVRYGSDYILTFGDPISVPNPKSEKISVFCPDFYDIEESSGWHFEREVFLSKQEFRQLCKRYLEENPEASTTWSEKSWVEPDQNHFNKAFSHTQQLISQGQIDKAVPCVFATLAESFSKHQLVKCLLSMMDLPENLYVYGYWDSEGGMLGATPELLFEKKGRHLSTMALAGTLPKSSDHRSEHLLKNKKELHENQLVVDDLRQQLSPLGKLIIKDRKILDLPTLWHLLTQIEVELYDDIDCVELAKKLHPTPALGVAPRRFGWRWMREWPQQEKRYRFGAPFLMKVAPEHWICLVAIRNLQWTQQEMIIASGCGVVRDSEVEREWLELFYKRESVKKLLGIKV